MNIEIKEFHDLEKLSVELAKDIVDLINRTVRTRKHFSIALSGGSTPQTLYKLLGGTYGKFIPWNSVEIFFCDERYVSPEDNQSNYRMVKENLLDLISIPQKNIHPIPTDYSNPEEAAQTYETELRKYFSSEGDTFDLVLLGMGKEGHTASLFPGSPALDEKKKWAAAIEVQATPSKRITLTFPILNRASEIYFIISGADKVEALEKVARQSASGMDGRADFHVYPASGILPTNGKLVWWIDQTVAVS
ncbi:MAG: 6-phosphogluconolactonase [Candidatus Kryptoniota bacterium]